MILENQGETTRNKYICKLAECILFDTEATELSSTEISKQIFDRFQLDFDVLEIENAIKLKGKGRITNNNKKYQLDPKVSNQLSTQTSAEDKLKLFIGKYIKQNNKEINEIELLELIQKFLYYSFNSNAANFITIIGSSPKATLDEKDNDNFKPTQEEIDIINDFISWDNLEKDQLFYSIVSSCYEYCLITTNKNPVISKSVFKGKKFFLDTNIIFRIAGVNKDERQFVIRNFINKCHEVGISLCYTDDILDELYRVIDSQIKHIRSVTQGQQPVDADYISKLSSNFEVNDFYILYCNWCKEPQNKHHDYMSFRNYLHKIINSVLNEFDFVQTPKTYNSGSDYSELAKSLKEYKNEKRPYRPTTDLSIKTDINHILFVESLRPKEAKSLWEMNEYIVSADQILVNWADGIFSGIPMVVIPSLWLSIILKVSGRASSDDYKSFCMFMTLRHHHTNDDSININPLELLSRLSERTINVKIKEQVITEIITNKSEYCFDNDDAYDQSVDKAFDKILADREEIHKEELKKAVSDEEKRSKIEFEKYEQELSDRKTEEEYARKFAINKATEKVKWFSQHENVYLLIWGLSILVAVVLLILFIVNIAKNYDKENSSFLLDIILSNIWSIIFFVPDILVATLGGKVWSYLSSKERKEKLCEKYFEKQLKVLNNK